MNKLRETKQANKSVPNQPRNILFNDPIFKHKFFKVCKIIRSGLYIMFSQVQSTIKSLSRGKYRTKLLL